MFLNFIKSFYRLYKRNKTITTFNIISLSVGLVVSIFILTWVNYEFAFDKYNENYPNVYRLLCKSDRLYAYVTNLLYNPIKEKIPELENTIRVDVNDETTVLKIENQVIQLDNFAYADADFFNIFSIEFVYGSKENAFQEPYSLVLTESVARKYFEGNPIGKKIVVDYDFPFTVTGVIKDLPEQSHIKISILADIAKKEQYHEWMNQWYCASVSMYALLPDGADPKYVAERIESTIAEINPNYMEDRTFKFEPLGDIHLFSEIRISHDSVQRTDIDKIIGLSIFGFLILVIAIFNYVNLQIASLQDRIKEYSIKKAMGANKWLLIKHLLTETSAYILISLLFSILIIFVLSNTFGSLINILPHLTDNLLQTTNLLHISGLLALVFILTSIYPLFFLSDKKSIVAGFNRQVLSTGILSSKTDRSFFRNAMICAQFIIAICFIIGSIIISKQLNYAITKNLGFDNEQLLIIKNPWEDKLGDEVMWRRYNLLKTKLLERNDVANISSGRYAPAQRVRDGYSFILQSRQDMDEYTNCGFVSVDYNYFPTIGGKIIQGRDFSKEFPTDHEDAVLINEAAAKATGVDDLIGEVISVGGDKRTIIGIVNNMQFRSVKQPVRPTVFKIREAYATRNIVVKLNSANLIETMKGIEKTWNNISPDRVFEYAFVDERLQKTYLSDIRANRLLIAFTVVAIVLSCMGILGLALLRIQKRIKEVGIRKVNGATTINIVTMLNIDFIKWVVVAFIIACPTGWYIMNKWLENFAYKTEIGWWIFALAGLLALAIALITISWQSWRAASRNPVEALRYE